MHRRDLIKSSVAAGMAFSAAPLLGAGSERKYRTALIGCGWWGRNILRYAMASGECRVVGLCDVDQNQLAGAAAAVEKLSGDQPKGYHDCRALLEKEKPEIAIIAMPDHWHALTAI